MSNAPSKIKRPRDIILAGAVIFVLAMCGCVVEEPMMSEHDDQEWSLDEGSMPYDERVAAVVDATNRARAVAQECGVHGVFEAAGVVERDELLEHAARAHANDMAEHNFVSHTGSDGSDVRTRAHRAGYRGPTLGENIAATRREAQALVQGWLDSDDHCRVLMNPRAELIGVGLTDGGAANDFPVYWVQVFGK